MPVRCYAVLLQTRWGSVGHRFWGQSYLYPMEVIGYPSGETEGSLGRLFHYFETFIFVFLQDISTRVIAEGLKPEETAVSKVMTRNPIFVMGDTLAVDALQKMVQGDLSSSSGTSFVGGVLLSSSQCIVDFVLLVALEVTRHPVVFAVFFKGSITGDEGGYNQF
jgi:hypothetical protein